MDRDRHDHIGQLFLKARQMAPRARQEFLSSLPPDDRRDVEELLQHDIPDDVPPESPRGIAGLDLGAARQSLAESQHHPETIGPYRILGVLGEGGMAVVYRAEQTSPRRTVALKLIRPGLTSESALRRFEYEVEFQGRLQHPGIAQIHDAGMADTGSGPRPYFAMELVEGRPLTTFAEEEQLSTRERLELFIRICEAVHHAHQKVVIHRDLKPSNILVDASGQPRILDFGIAKATNSDIHLTTLQTDVGQLIGTLAYMSPEQAAGQSKDLDTRSDVYALGVILYELLAGTLPYDVRGKLIHEAVRVIREEDPTPLSSVQRVFRGDLETIVSKSLEKDRERRYPSALDLGADARRYLRNEPIEARPPSVGYRFGRFAARNKALVSGLAAVILSLSLGLVASAVLFQRSEENARQARRNEQVALAKEQEADQQRERAEGRAEEVLRLSDVRNLEQLEAQARELWPAYPDKIPLMEDWLEKAEQLAGNLANHEVALRSVSEGALAASKAISADQQAWWQAALNDLVQNLRGFENPDPTIGTKANVQRRLEKNARSIWQRSVGDYEMEWDEAITEINLSELYDDLEIKEQIGLVPIGPDPHSGLWEFWHVESGDQPVRDDQTEELTITGKSGMVLVLLPEGTFTMGGQARDPSGPNFDPDAEIDETPLHDVTLSPFLLSKYEMTQGQWWRIMGERPSMYQGDDRPVEQVSFDESCEALLHVGLVLPTEAQWEYGARAGTSTQWWCGNSSTSIGDTQAGNLFDQKTVDQSPNLRAWGPNESWRDAYAYVAPVGRFAANPFGLHDVIGNVWEWCADLLGSYVVPVREDDGMRLVPPPKGPELRANRGGSFNLSAFYARSAGRSRSAAGLHTNDVGLRPARLLDH